MYNASSDSVFEEGVITQNERELIRFSELETLRQSWDGPASPAASNKCQ
jgi:hypothetical protein